MYSKYIKMALISTMLALTCSAKASLINTVNNSYVDDSTGLEWMDFGINNHYTYNEVVAELANGGVFSEWRLPSSQEVVTMWENIFLGFGQDVEVETYSSGTHFSWISASNSTGVFSSVFDTMNVPTQPGGLNNLSFGARLFNGGLDLLELSVSREYTNNVEYTYSFLLFVYEHEAGPEGLNLLRNSSDPYIGTFLVKNASSVNVPSVLVIFVIGLLCLTSYRRTSVMPVKAGNS